MRFRCRNCNLDMDESLLTGDQVRRFKREQIGLEGLECPFCRRKALELEEIE